MRCRLPKEARGSAIFVAVMALASITRGLDLPTLPSAPLAYEVGGQVTVVWQHLPPFHSDYEGTHSLRSRTDDAVSDSYTAYLGVRPLSWLEIYVDPEMIRGGGVGGGFGLAGYTNGEVIRNPSVGQDPYLARAFIRATLPLTDTTEAVDTDLNQIAGTRATQRITLTAGILSTTDVFDTNRYAGNTRTQFLNWSFITNVAYDFAADTRGYTRGAALEWTTDDWTVRAGTFQMPKVANGETLDSDLANSHGDQLEIETHPTLVPERAAVVRVLAYQNHARMGDYHRAVLTAPPGTAPQVESTRERNALKYGFGLNLEQPLDASGDTGLFARLGWNDGATESFAFTEAESTVSGGAQVAGAWWGRAPDRVGLAAAMNGLSTRHSDYLAAGGLGFALGDGRLHYAPESIFEAYYAIEVWRDIVLTPDYQLVVHPGYNRDRGPVSVVGLRLHLQAVAAAVPASEIATALLP